MTLSDEDDLTAAELVLGTLDAGERSAATARRSADASFDRAVEAWELRLSPLSETTPEAVPSSDVWDAILRRLGGVPGPSGTVVAIGGRSAALQRQVQRWRAAAALSTALAAGLAGWIAVGPAHLRDGGGTELVAFLQRSGDDPAYVMGVNLTDERLSVRPVSGRAPEGKSYELWIIDPAIGAPESLGVLNAAVTTRRVPPNISHEIASRATYAVTLEAAGGSATGAPTSSPVFVGHLVETPR